MQAYRSLEGRFSRLASIEDAIGILQWDAETMMPEGAGESRADQLATLKGMAHELLTSRETRDLLGEAARDQDPLNEWQRANLREMQRLYLHAAAVPGDLVEANAKAVSRAEMTWRSARRDGDFAQLKPDLAAVLSLQRQIGEAKGVALGLTPYDALLDAYDPGLRRARIDPLFAQLRAELPDLIRQAQAVQAERPPIRPLDGPFPAEVQRRIGEQVMRAVGFDFGCGRLDVSLHPFCGGSTGGMSASPRGMTRAASSEPSWRSSTRPAMRSTSRAVPKGGVVSRSASRGA
jgi:carboxypeptidase Taq